MRVVQMRGCVDKAARQTYSTSPFSEEFQYWNFLLKTTFEGSVARDTNHAAGRNSDRYSSRSTQTVLAT